MTRGHCGTQCADRLTHPRLHRRARQRRNREQLSEAPDGRTALELQHATRTADHKIDGQVFDAIFCMGGGYYPRLFALDEHLRKALPHDYDPVAFHERPDRRAIIDRGSAAMANLLRARRETAVGR